MGHERAGALPPSKRWRDVVAQVVPAIQSTDELEMLAASTLRNVQDRFDGIHRDTGVQAAFGFLLDLASTSSAGELGRRAGAGIRLDSDPSVLELARAVHAWVDAHRESAEYAALAQQATADTIARWTRDRSKQGLLFGGGAEAIWREARSGAGFCELSRLFFAKFTERYLLYFLDREASAEAHSIADREKLAFDLEGFVDAVSRHAFELSRITQSFAAGWYNKHAVDHTPDNREVGNFLSVAFGKMREAIVRESLR